MILFSSGQDKKSLNLTYTWSTYANARAKQNNCNMFLNYLMLLHRPIVLYTFLRGYCTPGPYFGRLCAFSQNIKQLRTKYSMDLVRNVPRNSKNTVLLQLRPLLLSYSAKCELINILYVLSHKSITT